MPGLIRSTYVKVMSEADEEDAAGEHAADADEQHVGGA